VFELYAQGEMCGCRPEPHQGAPLLIEVESMEVTVTLTSPEGHAGTLPRLSRRPGSIPGGSDPQLR
jgi:hypothetical protein